MKGKKIVSTLLALLLLASLPMSARAAEYDIGNGDITVNAGSGGQTVTQGSQVDIPDSAPVITGSSTENIVTIHAGKDQTANVTLSDVNIDMGGKYDKAAVSTTGDGNVSIELNGDNKLRSGQDHAGLEKNNGGSLTIADEDKNGKLNGLTIVRLESKVDEKTGRRNMVEVSGSEKKIPAELVLIAAGFLGTEEYIAKAFGVELNQRTNVATEPGTYATNVKNVFVAGDMHRGQSLVVWAIREGREVAHDVDTSLMGYSYLSVQ